MDYQETLEKADINVATSGDNTIIAAPGAGKYIAIDFMAIVNTTAQSLQLKDGSTNYGGALPLGSLGAIVFENSIQNEHGVITLSDNSAFVISLGISAQVGGFVRYRIINK